MNDTVRFALVLTLVCAAGAAGVGGIYRLTREPIQIQTPAAPASKPSAAAIA